MKNFLVAAVFLISVASNAYQVTGPVVEVTPTKIIVMKGKDKWEIKKDGTVNADVKVGDKVTIEYFMTATSITSKKK